MVINAQCLPGKPDKAVPVTLILVQAGRGNVVGGCKLFLNQSHIDSLLAGSVIVYSSWNVIFML